jgi:hypothetical protein
MHNLFVHSPHFFRSYSLCALLSISFHFACFVLLGLIFMSYELFRRLLPDFDRALFEVLKKIRLSQS